MLSLKIISPTETLFDGEVDFVVLPGQRGQLGILPRHAPLLSALKKGKIEIRQKTRRQAFDIPAGFAQVLKDKVTVLIPEVANTS